MLRKFLVVVSMLLSLAALTCAAEGAESVTVDFSRHYADNQERALLTAVDESGNTLWSRWTESYECMQLDAVNELAANDGAYYYVEGGTVVALDLSDGTELWRNADFGGSASDYAFGEDGTLYLCGYMGPDLFAVDAQGDTLTLIDVLDGALYWPYEMEYLGDRLAIRFEGSDNFYGDTVLYVSLEDFSGWRADDPDVDAELSFDEKIQHIKTVYYDTQEHLSEYDRFDGEGGMIYYFDGEELKKIVAPAGLYAGERDGAERYAAEYYYENGGQLVFAFVFHKTEENRYYICDGNCIRWIDDAGNITDWPDGISVFDDFSDTSFFCQFGYMEPHWAGLE